MKKALLFVVMVWMAFLLAGQEQPEQIPVQSDQAPQVAAEPQEAAKAPAQVQGKDLRRIRFPQAFIHAGKEYAAGDYWLVLAARDGESFFSVQNAQKEPLFDELAIVKTRSGGGRGAGYRVNKQTTRDGEYFRVRVTTASEWLLGYFLIKR